MLLIASFSLLEPGPILGPKVPGDSFIIINGHWSRTGWTSAYYGDMDDPTHHIIIIITIIITSETGNKEKKKKSLLQNLN